MKVESAAIDTVLGHAQDAGLVSSVEQAEVPSLLKPDFPYTSVLNFCDSVHTHINVEDVGKLPHDYLIGLGYRSENAAYGYIKYATDRGVNLTFSSILIAEDDNTPSAVTAATARRRCEAGAYIFNGHHPEPGCSS